jgi:hypothetical protein
MDSGENEGLSSGIWSAALIWVSSRIRVMETCFPKIVSPGNVFFHKLFPDHIIFPRYLGSKVPPGKVGRYTDVFWFISSDMIHTNSSTSTNNSSLPWKTTANPNPTWTLNDHDLWLSLLNQPLIPVFYPRRLVHGNVSQCLEGANFSSAANNSRVQSCSLPGTTVQHYPGHDRI